MRPQDRYHHLDALRGIAMLLGVVLHATLSLSEPPVLRWSTWDVSSTASVAWVVVGIHAFRMQLFFMMAGFFARLLYTRIGEQAFVRHRLTRIGIPFVVSCLVLAPLTLWTHMVGIQAMDESTLTARFLQYGDGWEHIYDFYKAGPSALFRPGFLLDRYRIFHLWFLEYLAFMYLGWLLLLRWPAARGFGDRLARFTERGLTGVWGLPVLALLLVPLLLTTPEVNPTPKLVPHLPTLAYYSLFFGIGWAAHRAPAILDGLADRWRVKLALCLVLLPVVMWLRTEVVGELEGDLVWAPLGARALYASVSALLTVVSTAGILGAFTAVFQQERRWVRYLADASYWIYLVHLPLIKLMHAGIADVAVNAWVKLVGVSLAATALTLLSYAGFVRHTFLGRVLHGPRDRATVTSPTMDAHLLRAVPLVAGTLMAFEVLTHRQLLLVADGLSAMTAIPIAVMGLGFGGLLCHRSLEDDQAPSRHAWGYVFSVAALLVALPLLGDWLVRAAPLLMAPYIFGGALLSRAFARLPTSRVYPLDLAAAAGGVVAVALLLPLLREEGLHLLLVGLTLGVPAVLSASARRTAGASALLVALLFGAQMVWTPYSLATATGQVLPSMARSRGITPGARFDKVFSALRYDDSLVYERSASSISGRVDIVRQFTSSSESFLRVYENGNSIDVMFTRPVDKHLWDPRLPVPILADDPDIFIIGTAGEGILKSSRFLGGHVSGSEIDTALLGLATGPLAEACGHCYDEVEVVPDEGRASLTRRDTRYDVITLLNTHVSKGMVEHRAADAEFIHTVQANRLMFDRLTDDGVILWEHPRATSSGGRVLLKQISTAWEALLHLGVTQPWRHTVIWRWGAYDQVAISRQPLTVLQLENFENWLLRDKTNYDGTPPATEVVWAPHQPERAQGPVAEWMRSIATDRPMIGGIHPSKLIITDNRPFPFDLPNARSTLYSALGLIGLLGALATGLLGRATSRTATGPWSRSLALSALSGFAYLFVEAVLLHQLPLMVGNPSLAVTLVLVGMLLASGLGSAALPRMGPSQRRIALVLTPIAIACLGLGIPTLSPAILALPFLARCLVALAMVSVPALLMGLPLTLAVDHARQESGEPMGALLFAVNGSAGAGGVLAAMVLAVSMGFSVVWWIGAGLYVAVAALAWR